MADGHGSDAHLVDDVFWIVLGRAATPLERRDAIRGLSSQALADLVTRLITSPEFQYRRGSVGERGAFGNRPELERGLGSVGDDQAFVRRAYECLLGRPADRSGLQHYTGGLAAGEPRSSIVRALMVSDEFARRFREVAPQNGVIPRDMQLCELANPAKWDNQEWLDVLRSLGLSDDKLSMHRKPYEFTQLIFGCEQLGVLTDTARILSVGAGHEQVLYWLANRVGRVVATDMYEGAWQTARAHEGDPGVIRRPEDYAPFPYRRDHLVFMRMDGRHLAFSEGTFDIAYSLSSIEHFGSMAGATAAIREMTRVLKPGGVLALATEYVLNGPPHEETFQPHEFATLIDQPELQLVQPVDENVYRRYEYAAIDLHKNPYQTPHMVVRFGDTVFTTVMVFLRRM